MILHRVCVENWRSLRERVELAKLNPGLNIIHGPNEIGKSTLMDAICRGFFDRHNTAGTAMARRQPWGTSLGPKVTIELEIAAQTYRLTKRFLDEPMCELYEFHNGTWERTDRGRRADERIIELTYGDATSRGLSGPQHWGLGQVLWAQQGRATHLSVGDSQQARLRESLKITLENTRGEAIESEISRRYDEIYAPGGGYHRGRKNKAAVVRLEEDCDEAKQATEQIDQAILEAQQLAHNLTAAEDEYEQTEREYEQAQQDLGAKRRQLRALERQLREYQQRQAAAEKARSDWEQLNGYANRIAAADKAVKDAEEALDKLQVEYRKAQDRLESAEGRFGVARRKRDTMVAGLKACEKALAAADRLLQWAECRDGLQIVRKQHKQAKEIARQLAEAHRELEGLAAPTPRQMSAIDRLDRQICRERAKLDAASLAVRIEPKRRLSIHMKCDGESLGRRQVSKRLDVKAVSEVYLNIKTVGSISVRSGTSDAAALAANLESLERAWRKRTAAFGSSQLHELQQRTAKSQLITARIKDLQKQLDSHEDLKALAKQVRKLEQTRKTLLVEDRSPAHGGNNLAQARKAVRRARLARQKAARELECGEAAVKQARRVLDEANKAASDIRQRTGGEEAKRDTWRGEADRLRKEDGRSDKARRAELVQALRLKDEAEQRLEASQKPPVEDLANEIEKLEAVVNRLQADLGDQSRKVVSLKTQLDPAGGQGLYSQYVVVAEKQEDLTRQLKQARREADAVKLLWETLQRHKKDAFEVLIRPIRHMVTADMRRLVGPSYEEVEFGDRLTPTSLRPVGRDVRVDVEQDLSFGTQEQLMLMVRLSLARLLGREGDRQSVILDDPLVNTDRSRHRAALRLLEAAAADAQILIFTCHAVAYEGLSGAAKFDLQALTTKTVISQH